MRKIKLRKSLATNIIVLFLVFNIISVFLFTYYVTMKEEDKAVEYAKSSLQEIVNEKSELISITFDRIETQVQLLGIWTEKLLRGGHVQNSLSDEYALTEDGSLYRRKETNRPDRAQSNIMVPKGAEKDLEVISQINLTQQLDESFEKIIEKEDVTWAYIATKDNLLRVSPYRDLQEDFDSSHEHISDVFYTAANAENDAERKAIWTPPYTDYLGRGWTMTCTQPVYDKNDEMYGVVCLDLAIENIKEKFFEGFSLGETGKVCWINSSGNIFFHTDYSTDTADQGEVYEKNIFELKALTPEREQVLRNAISKEKGIQVFSEDSEQKIMVHSHVPETDSILIIEMDMKEFITSKTFDLEKSAVLLLINLILMAVFALLLYDKFSRPMGKLVHSADRIARGDYSFIKEADDRPEESYYEIARLNRAFRVMNDSIERYTESLVSKNREIGMILDTIDNTLLIVDMEAAVCIRTKDTKGISQERIKQAVRRIRREKQYFSEQVMEEGEMYKNDYYPILSEDGSPVKIVISSECITKDILMEKELQQLEKMAGMGQLSAAIVHELKNVLARIKGAAYILKLMDEQGTGQKEITSIMKAVEEAENTITTLLDFSREDKEGSEVIHISTLINQILLLSNKEIIGKNIDMQLALDENCYIYASGKEAMKVILQNIIINGIQAAGCDGKMKIRCYKEGDHALVSIWDNGGGIGVQPRERVFEPFFTTKAEGTGIGLWITKRLTDSLHATIRIAEPAAGGTEFIITIPVNTREKDHDKIADSACR